MNAHILQHVSFEDVGCIGPWLQKAGANVAYTRFFEKVSLPPIGDLDLVIVMGGPMSVNDEANFPWLCVEKEFIRDAAKSGVAVLGVCLGAQLIASAFGSRVYRNTKKEIGWFPIQSTTCDENVFILPEECTVFHWHGETFDIPPGGVRLAKSKACENQAFQIGRNVIGLQFHLEMNARGVTLLLDHCRDELMSSQYIQAETALRSVNVKEYARINLIMDSVLSYLLSGRK